MKQRFVNTIGPILLVTVLVGCAATQQARDVETTGFLTNYAQLEPGGGEYALLVYVNPDTDFRRYDRILIDPVTLWRGSASRLDDVPEDELQGLADYLDASLRETLKQDYTLVRQPAPGVMRLRVAITEAEGASVAMDTVSTIIPQARLLSGAKKLATGTHAFVGSAGVEGELVDAVSGERLMAAVDRRVGGKRVAGVTSTWDDVRGAFDFWSERVRTRLAELRAR